MNKASFVVVFTAVLSGVSVGLALAQQPDGSPFPVMRFDRPALERLVRAHNRAPRARIDARVSPTRGPYSLLSHVRYVPEERNQGRCANCWNWAGTGCMEIALDVQNRILDRLSVQYLNSNEKAAISKECCDVGSLDDFAKFYSTSGMTAAVPWSNAGAQWQDGDGGCDTPGSAITTLPNYPIKSIKAEAITADGTNAVEQIKNVLNQGRGIAFCFLLPSQADWNRFFDMWNSQTETEAVALDYACGHTWTNGNGGHTVLCVGYDDSDPTNRYWVMLNSWGTAGGRRPNGIFRVRMDMDYGCYVTYEGAHYASFYWDCLNMAYDLGATGTVGPAVQPWGKPRPGLSARDAAVVIDTAPKQEFTLVTPANRAVDLFIGTAATPDQADVRLAYTGDRGMGRLPAKTFAANFEGRWMIIGNMGAPSTFGKLFTLKQGLATADGVQWVFRHNLKSGDTAGIYQNIDGNWVNTHTIVCH